MPRTIAPFVFWVTLAVSTPSMAQFFDSFRFVGSTMPASPGTVTSVSLDADEPRGTLSFLNAAGLSSVFEIRFTPSSVVREGIPVFLPDESFGTRAPLDIGLESIEFFTGALLNDGSSEPPVHWFRMTRHNGKWSGIFRVSNRIYSIDRFSQSSVIDVRARPTNTLQQPARRVKVSAVIDEQFVYADSVGDSTGMDNLGHVFALESLHVLDGLSSESLGVSVEVEQIVFQSSDTLDNQVRNGDRVDGAQRWLQSNSVIFGLEDNIAVFVFRGANPLASTIPEQATGEDVIVQSSSADYQLASSHYFGKLIGIPDEVATIQHRTTGTAVAFPNAHWSEQQREFIEVNPLPGAKTQLLNFDEPQVASPPPAPTDVLAPPLIDSDQEESTFDDILLNDTPTGIDANSGTGGSGSLDLAWLLFVLAISTHRLVIRRGQ